MKPLRIIQISDTNLHPTEGEGLDRNLACNRLDPTETLATVLDDIQINEPAFDAIVVTGDIAQTGEADAYRCFASMLKGEGVPVYCLPGSHDDRLELRKALDGKVVSMPRYIVNEHWLMLFIGSAKSDSHKGEIPQIQLNWIHALATHYPDHHIALFTHHHPLATGSTWLDEHYGMDHCEQLLESFSGVRQIKAIVCGHIHQPMDCVCKGIRVLGTPSTCVQFQPETAQMTISVAAPAYRRIAFLPEGKIETEVVYSHQPLSKIA